MDLDDSLNIDEALAVPLQERIIPNRTEVNAGNYDLLDRRICRALPEG